MLNKDKLLKLRKGKKITQAEMAKNIGIERTTYGRYETGEINPPSDMVLSMANFFDVSVDYLLDNTNNPTPPNGNEDDEVWQLREELHKRPELKMLFETSRKAKKEDVEFADKFLKGVAKENDYD